MDFSYSILHNLVIAKLEDYALDIDRLNIMHSHPTGCCRKVKVGSS